MHRWDVYFDGKADLTGTGDRSEKAIIILTLFICRCVVLL